MENGIAEDPTEPNGAREWVGEFDPLQDREEELVIFAALDSFRQYRKTAHYNVTHRRRQNFYALPSLQWQILAEPPISLLEKLDAVDDAIDCNAEIAEAVLLKGLQAFGLSSHPQTGSARDWRGAAKPGDMIKAHSTIRQFYRDWSAEGSPERKACYEPVLRDLRVRLNQSLLFNTLNPKCPRVLVPGAGLGRLVFELCKAGYDTEGNEISYHQLLASSWILNHIIRREEYSLYPFASQFTNVQSRQHQLRRVMIPDIHPGQDLAAAAAAAGTANDRPSRVGEMNMTAADFVVLYGGQDQRGTFDAVVTVFFIDTAPNFMRYIDTIQNCLKAGGIWINLGPLLWHFDDRAPADIEQQRNQHQQSRQNRKNEDDGIGEPGSFELTEAEVIDLVQKKGFTIELQESVPNGVGYIQDPYSMLQNLYQVSHWVARKR